MVTTRSKARKLDNDGSVSLPSLKHDILISIMIRVGLFDFIALSSVCKSWRSVAVSHWNQVMMSKQPMCLSLSNRMSKKECYLDDHTRKLKTMIPNSRGRICVGITCGYLIFYGKKTCDFWLVNPVTRKELHFPGFPFNTSTIPTQIKGILVFSPLISGWVFVVLSRRFSSGLSFFLGGKQAKWGYISSNSFILDLHFFKGKVYMVNTDNLLFELRLNPRPAFALHRMKNNPWSDYRYDKLVSSGEKLYLMDPSSKHFDAIEANFEKSEWMNSERTIDEYDVFISGLKCDAAIKPETWANPWAQYQKLNYVDDGDQSKIRGRCLTTNMWYFPHDCLNDTKNGVLLNTLEGESKEVGGSSSWVSCKRIDKLVLKRLRPYNQPI